MSVDKDPLLTGRRWRCRICMRTQGLTDGGAGDLLAMEQHVKRHRSVMTGSKDPATENMKWRDFIQPIGAESNMSATRYT